jgi:hypothetical protein
MGSQSNLRNYAMLGPRRIVTNNVERTVMRRVLIAELHLAGLDLAGHGISPWAKRFRRLQAS